jgi:hypothetical protein
MFVIFGLVVLFLPSAPLGSQHAGAQASPSGSGPVIQFLNPSGATTDSATSGPGKEVSTNTDDGNGYHLVAWVGRIPSNPSVDFKWSNSDGTNETFIGAGTLRGTDTFDIFWNAMPATDGAYKVKAILYSNGVQVSTDTEDVLVNDRDAPTTGPPTNIPQGENRGQALEITYPTQAGPWGAFRKPGTSDPYVGVVDVTKSAGTTTVRTYYTVSPPGNEPAWTKCNSPSTGETAANSVDGVRCTLAAGVNPASVTAIAAASGDANQSIDAGTCAPASTCGEGEDSGDAHRAFGYVQIPGSVTLAPPTQRVDDDPAVAETQYPCSANITATVLDQFSRKVAGANVDIHAAGPTDNLYFDDPDTAGGYQPPNSNNHTTEGTVSCEDAGYPKGFNTAAGQGQGEHEVQGEGDIKHIETIAAGTNDAGQVVFKMNNRTSGTSVVPGVTQITAYYDRDDDDRLCAQEPQGDAAIGWGADAGSPTGVADETPSCTEPTASPTTSSSASASATPSRSPSASASGSASPSSSPGTSRTITFVASDAKVNTGAQVTLSGRIFSSNASCTDNEFVQITRRVHGTNQFQNLTTTQTAADGQFEKSLTVTRSASYQAVSPAHDNCATASSDPVTVLVKVKVSIDVSDFRPERGSTVTFTGKVTPGHGGTKVVLQRKKGGRWVKVDTDQLNNRSRYSITIDAFWRQDRAFRIKWSSSDEDHEANTSQSVKVTTHS